MRKEWLLIGLLVMTGCASVGDLREKGPSQSFASEKEPASLYECITYSWDNIKIGGSPQAISQQHIGGVYSVMNGPSNILELADISSATNGSLIKFYHSKGLADWRELRFVDAIKACI